nr:MAG TPA: hypothetical protein [Caudoviricetes sp.]
MFPVHSGHAVSAIYILLPFIHGAGGLEWLEDILTEAVILTIIYLTRQPEGECTSPTPAKDIKK